MAKPLLSVVVPTKDRYKYLKHLIKLIQSFNSDEIEIVVQDNTTDNKEILDFLSELNYSGCKYFHETGQLPMSTNADKAILHSEGEYVCFLGDDDGVCPNALDYCRYMKEHGYEALRSNVIAYNWPDCGGSIDNKVGVVYIKYSTMNEREITSISELKDVFTRGFVDRGNLPSVYHGIVSRNTLNEIYSISKTFFPGQSPDISNGVAVSLVLDSYLYVDDIVTISGASKFHGGKTVGMKKQYPQISDMVWFRPQAEELWDKRLPKIAVGYIIWAESTIETLKNMGRSDLIKSIDFEKVYKEFAVNYFPLKGMVYPLTTNFYSLFLYSYVFFIVRVGKAIIRRIRAAINKYPKGVSVISGIIDINMCVDSLRTNVK